MQLSRLGRHLRHLYWRHLRATDASTKTWTRALKGPQADTVKIAQTHMVRYTSQWLVDFWSQAYEAAADAGVVGAESHCGNNPAPVQRYQPALASSLIQAKLTRPHQRI